MSEFTGKTVVITGAAGNLGRAVADKFRAAGANLALTDRSLEILQSAFAGWDNALLCAADIADENSVATLALQTLDKFQRIEVLANVAGGFSMGPPLHQTSLEAWDSMLDLNAKSVFLTCRAVIPAMLAQGGGKIVNVAARAALEGKAKMAPYIVSKAAVVRLTESMAAELRDQNINVNCILPGTIDTPANRKDMPSADFSRWVAPAALADVIVFLASDAARAVNGAAVPVYGRS
jgi:NAD(P)-dependent dehydrogenase (short-subunit alcohol dehydrogenase family)